MIIYIGSFFIFLGSLFLFVPIIYLELGRPKDLIKAFLNLLIGVILIIKNKIFDVRSSLIFFLLTVLVFFYILEIFSSRWNQLTDQEKKKLITFLEFKKNLTKIIEAINLGTSNFKNTLKFFKFTQNNQKINLKRWVRNDKNDIIDS